MTALFASIDIQRNKHHRDRKVETTSINYFGISTLLFSQSKLLGYTVIFFFLMSVFLSMSVFLILTKQTDDFGLFPTPSPLELMSAWILLEETMHPSFTAFYLESHLNIT